VNLPEIDDLSTNQTTSSIAGIHLSKSLRPLAAAFAKPARGVITDGTSAQLAPLPPISSPLNPLRSVNAGKTEACPST